MNELEALTAAEPKRDRYGRPMVTPRNGGKPKPFTRPTTIADTLDDRHNLELWMQRQVLKGSIARPDLHALAATTDPDDKSALNKLCGQLRDAAASDAGANMGTAVHAAIEAVNRGRDAPVMFAEHVEAYTTLLDGIGATVDRDHVEQFVVNETVGAAGTFDMRLQIDGVWYVADLKTGSTVEWSARSFAIQLAIYQGHTSIYDWATNTHDLPLVLDDDRGIIVHLPANDPSAAAAHWIDLAAGREALERALWVREWRKRKGLLVPFEVTPSDDAALTGPTATPRPKGSQRIEPVGTAEPVTPTTAPEGGPADADKVVALLERARSDAGVAATVNRWVRDAARAHVDWRIGIEAQYSTERRYALSYVAVELAEHLCSGADDAALEDEVARAALAMVIGDDAHQPILAVGGLIGTLTIDQARRLVRIANSARLTFSDDGSPRLIVAA